MQRKPRMTKPQLVPGEVIVAEGDLVLNEGRRTLTLSVANGGDRLIQVGSHYHFSETNPALRFDRARSMGFRLDIPPGTAVLFEPGQTRKVRLVSIPGTQTVYGFRGEVMGELTSDKKAR